MAIENSRFKTRREREEEEKKKQQAGGFVLPTYEELTAIEEKAKEDAARVASSEKKIELFQKPSNWDDGYQFGDVTKSILGTVGDVGVGAVKGVMKLGEGVGDALQYGAAAIADLVGADDKAEAIRKNAQREAVADAFRGVDEKLDRYSVLGRTSDAAAESLGQIGGILATGGIAGALGAGAVGATAATTGVMGLSSFGSGTGEAYAAGAEEGEAEAYGAIAGAADALSEMIFGGLGKGFKALGLSKGITSADDMLAKAVTSKIRSTLAKNTVQLGIKAGAEGIEEVLAGTMQAAGKKMTYMSERDFADIIRDENLLEQFVVGSFASGVAQVPSFVRANRAGVDLVSDDDVDADNENADLVDMADGQRSTETAGEGAGQPRRVWEDNAPEYAEIERTGRVSGADEDTMRLAREVSSLTGRGIRFFRQDAQNGYINNGYYDPDAGAIYINTASKNPAAQILSHELTHSIEGTDSYGKLRALIFDRMKAEGADIDAEYRKKEMLYTNAGVRLRTEAEIAHEVIAEYVEKNLLTDSDKITSLVSENRTLGQRIREWLDSVLARLGDASAKQRDFVRRARDLYAEALGEDVSKSGDNIIKHDIAVTEDGKMYVTASRNVITGKNTNEKRDQITQFFRELLQNKPSLEIKTVEGDVLTLTMGQTANKARDNYKQVSGNSVQMTEDEFRVKLQAESHIDEIAEISKRDRQPMRADEKNHPFAKDGFTYRKAYFEDFDGKYYEITFSVGHNGNTATVYNVGKIKESVPPSANLIAVVGSQPRGKTLSEHSISQDGENVNREFSVSEEKQTDDPLAGVSSAVDTEVEEIDVPSERGRGEQTGDGYIVDEPAVRNDKDEGTNRAKEKKQGESKKTEEKRMTRVRAMSNVNLRQAVRDERKTVDRAQTAFRRLGYHIAGAVSENYEDAAGIVEDTRLAAQADYDIGEYIEDNDVRPHVDSIAKLIATGEVKPTRYATGLTGEQLKMATELAQMYKQYDELAQNTIKAQGKAETMRINEEYDRILGDYNWFSDKGKKGKRLGDQLQLNLSNPEQVMRDAFGDAYTITDGEGNQKTVDVAEALNDYLIRPTIENSAEARRQTNRQVARLREFGLNESESALTQLYAEYSAMKEAGSKKVLLDKRVLRELLLGTRDAREVAHKIALKEGEIERSGKEGENGFTQSIIDVFENAQKVNRKRAAERALREHKEEGGTKGSWNALSKTEKQAKLEAAAEAIVDESLERIEGAAREMRVLLDDMYEAINAISVIHGAQPIPFRRGYMPHSHRQKTEVQQWFSEHMGGIDVTPVGDLPTDIAGKTAGRKPNKRWMAHAQQRTGPRTTWDALGNIEEYLRIANDTIYHMDDIKKMRVLERYIRGIYSVARGETGETMKKKVKNDVMQRMYGSADDETLVFLGLKKNEKPVVNDEDMDLSQMTPLVTWLTNYANDLAAKQIFNRDIESVAGRKYNNLANKITSWSSRVMMQYNISSNLKQLSQLGTVSGDVGAKITKDAAAMTVRSMRNLGNGTNELEQKYHISERSTFLAEKAKIEEATFAFDHDLTDKQKKQRDDAAEIWDYAWSFTDTAMSRFAVYSYFMEGMERGMDDTAALQYADAKARNILASRMKGSSPLIFQSKNPILRLFTMFQREPLAAWQDVLKTMPREYAEMQKIKGEAEAKTWLAKRITGRVLGASMVNMFYATVLGLGTPAMFDLLGAPLSALLEKVIGDLTEDEDDDQTWGETLKGLTGNLRNEIADDIPFASLINMIVNTAVGTEFESRLPLNMPDYKKFEEVFKSPARVRELTKKIEEADDAETIEALTGDRDNAEKQVPFTVLAAILEIVGVAAPAGNQIRKSVSGLVSALRGGEYASDGRLKYEISGADAVRAVVLGKSNTKAAQEWIDSDYDSYTKTETAAYEALIDAGVSAKDAADYVKRVTDTEYDKDVETKASAQARKIDRMKELDDAQRAELYYTMVATEVQRNAVDDAVSAGADKADAVDTARDIRDASKRLDKLTALSASDMDTEAREAMYLSMIATKEKDEDGNIIGTDDDARLEALYTVGLDFDDFLDAKIKQSALNANEGLTANQRAARFLSWVSGEGYNSRQEEAIAEQFSFASGFKAEPATYKKMVMGGVTTDNAIKLSDALSGADRTIDKINAMWGTGIIGEQLDLAIKAVVSDSQYEKYRIIIDANVPLEVYTWVLDNADANGNGSINAEERTQILSRLALSRKELSALWLATGGSEKSNPWGSGGTSSSKVSIKTPTVKMPEIKMPEINFNVPRFDFEFGGR